MLTERYWRRQRDCADATDASIHHVTTNMRQLARQGRYRLCLSAFYKNATMWSFMGNGASRDASEREFWTTVEYMRGNYSA